MDADHPAKGVPFARRSTVVARRASGGGSRSRIEIVELELGSLKTKIIAAASLVVTSAQLAVAIAAELKTSPPAAKATLAIIENSPGAVVFVSGGGVNAKPVLEDDVRAAAMLRPSPQKERGVEILSGPQGGFVRNIGHEFYVELDSRPNLYIKIRDQRETDEPFEDGSRYTLEGDAHIGSQGRPSFFLVNHAILLG